MIDQWVGLQVQRTHKGAQECDAIKSTRTHKRHPTNDQTNLGLGGALRLGLGALRLGLGALGLGLGSLRLGLGCARESNH